MTVKLEIHIAHVDGITEHRRVARNVADAKHFLMWYDTVGSSVSMKATTEDSQDTYTLLEILGAAGL